MIIVYHCPVCESTPTAYVPLLLPRRPIVVQCSYCGAIVEIPKKKPKELNVDDVMQEAKMILAGNK